MEHTKGKLEIVIIGKFDYHKLCRIGDTEHKDVLEDIPTEQAIVYLKELVRRWNAFEDGGLVDELRKACQEGLAECQRSAHILNIDKNGLPERITLIEAALAKS